MKTWPAVALAGAAILALILWQNHTISTLREELTDFQLRENDRLVQEFDSLAARRRDTVQVIERTIRDLSTKRTEYETLVQNTRDVDSLVSLYWSHRSSLAD